MFPVDIAAQLAFHWNCVGFFPSHCAELVRPTLCCCCCCIYILLCFTIFSHRALDHCPFWENRYRVPNPSSSWQKCLYLGTCEPSVEVVVANVSVKGIWQGVSWKPFKTCASSDVPGMQMASRQRILRPDELQRWLEWCSRCWRTAKPLFHYRKWPFCSHPLFSDPCVSLSFTDAFTPPLCPRLSFTDQQAVKDKPENDSVIISFINL